MAHLSCDGGELLALSVNNHLQIINLNSNEPVLKYVNETLNIADSKDSSFVKHVFSTDGYFAAITGDKKLLVWNILERSITLTSELPKRPTCLCFCNKERTVIVGDKSGDVYRYTLADENRNSDPQPLLGHLSMVLDVAMAYDDSFIVSADRDEKIRVSFYPNAYSIHSYCLGHTQLVSAVSMVSNDYLISGSADKTLRLWDFKDGTELSRSDLNDKVFPGTVVISRIVCHQGDVAVIGEGSNTVLFFSVEGNALTYQDSSHLSQQPIDICYQGGKLCILTRDDTKQIIVLEKHNESYAEKYVSFTNMLQDESFSTKALGDSKCLTELVKPPSKKRTNEEITPQSTIEYVSNAKTIRIEA